MNNIELVFSIIIVILITMVLLGPFIILRLKKYHRHDVKPIFSTTGTSKELFSGSMIPTLRFDLYSDGLCISGLLQNRFISKNEISSVKKVQKWLRTYIELNLDSGESIFIVTLENKKLLNNLNMIVENNRKNLDKRQ